MIVTPVPHELVGIGVSTGDRSPGLHASDIYGDLYQELEPTRYRRDTAPDPLRLEAGLAFESLLEEGLKRRLCGERPGEFTTDEGVIFSPDLIIFNHVTRVGEIKLTWMSSNEIPTVLSNGLPPKFDKWLTQIKFYCRAVETCYGRLIGFFVNGDYRPPSPRLLAWDLQFTKRELDENHTMLMNHARHRGLL